MENSQKSRDKISKSNSDFPWDEFDSTWYFNHNYKELREDDRQIVELVRDFFVAGDLSGHCCGIDVGAGSNLYPALTMLPFCDEITLYEYAASNVTWLQQEVQCYSTSWDPLWDLLVKEPLYKSVEFPRKALAAAARVKRGSIFELPKSQWDMGTMFFVAESISSKWSEFHAALTSFIGSLRPGARFAAAFMEKSEGYDVGAHRFPAVAVTKKIIKSCLVDKTEDLNVCRLGMTKTPLRSGYTGMIVALGRVQIELQNGRDDR